MITLNVFFKGIAGALGGVLCFLIYCLAIYYKSLFKKYVSFIKTKDTSNLRIWELMIFCVVSFAITWILSFSLLYATVDRFTLSGDDKAIIALFIALVIMLLIIIPYPKHYKAARKKKVQVVETNTETTSDDESKKSKHIFKKTILSLLLIVYILFSLLFMGSKYEEIYSFGWFYIPFWGVICIHYLCLIWKESKMSGANMLFLPLLQKIKLFESYNDTLQERKELAKTSLPFILSMFICPMLASLLCITHIRSNTTPILLLLLPPFTLIASLAISAVHGWSNKDVKSDVNEKKQ